MAPQVEPASKARATPTIEVAGAPPADASGGPPAGASETAKARAAGTAKAERSTAPRTNAPATPGTKAPATPRTDVAVNSPAPRSSAAHGRRYKRREVALAEGGKLVLHGDGSISRVDAAGETTATWATDDPDWARHGIRFGLHPEALTVAPHGRQAADPRPLGG